jgi:hypothetical protein
METGDHDRRLDRGERIPALRNLDARSLERIRVNRAQLGRSACFLQSGFVRTGKH